MKTLKTSIAGKKAFRKLSAYLAATVTVALFALIASNLSGTARADTRGRLKAQDELKHIEQNVQVAELDQLAANFHGALSYGGNITIMMSLWADNSSITLNGAAHVGKAAVQAFFTGSGYFLNNWVSLAPEYKTEITIHGDTAEITTQCVAVDLSASPMVVKSVIQVNAICEKIDGQWLFVSMNNTSPAPL